MAAEQLPLPPARGRPRKTGDARCPRCERVTNRLDPIAPRVLLCRSCIETALHTHGVCGACGRRTLLPGLDTSGQPICGTCAGYARDFHCTHCGNERAPYRQGLCEFCSLANDLDELLPLNHPLAKSLREHFLDAARPRSIISWLRNPEARQLITDVTHGNIEITHEALDELPQTKSLDHIRALLVGRGHLPLRDEALARFTAWIPRKVNAVTGTESRDALRRYATWHHLRRVRESASTSRGAASASHYAKQEITVAGNFLNWLDDRGTTLRQCTQEDVDDWLSEGPTTRYAVKNFLTFAAKSRLSRPLIVPRRAVKSIRRIDADERLNFIRACLDADQHPAAIRLMALLLLLFGQPISRISTMAVDDVQVDDSGARIRFTDDWIELPSPFSELLARVASR